MFFLRVCKVKHDKYFETKNWKFRLPTKWTTKISESWKLMSVSYCFLYPWSFHHIWNHLHFYFFLHRKFNCGHLWFSFQIHYLVLSLSLLLILDAKNIFFLVTWAHLIGKQGLLGLLSHRWCEIRITLQSRDKFSYNFIPTINCINSF